MFFFGRQTYFLFEDEKLDPLSEDVYKTSGFMFLGMLMLRIPVFCTFPNASDVKYGKLHLEIWLNCRMLTSFMKSLHLLKESTVFLLFFYQGKRAVSRNRTEEHGFSHAD